LPAVLAAGEELCVWASFFGGYPPVAEIQPVTYLASVETKARVQNLEWRNKMKNRITVICVAMSALMLSFLLVGCDREVSKEQSSSVSRDGTVQSKEKTVTKAPDGTVTKTEETKKTTPPEKP
jgi:hypothetical protein